MKIETEIQDDHQAKIKVEIETESFDQVKRRSAKKISKRTKIAGFRPGKAPFPVVQRHVGEAAILEEALDMLIDEIYPKVIEQSEIEPYGPGTLDDLESTDPPVLHFLVPLSPDVELGDYQSIEYPYETPEVEEQEVEDVIKQVQENQAIIEPVERETGEGDVVYVRVSGKETRTDKESSDDDLEVVPERRLNILIQAKGEEPEGEWPFPGFSRGLIGLSAGETKSIEYSFPEEDEFYNLSGKDMTFEALVDEVKSRELPPVDDELAQSLGDYEDLEALRAYITETLLHNKIHEYNNEYDSQIMDDLMETSTIKFPPQMLANEVQVMTDQMANELGSQGLDLATYLKTRDLDETGLEEELKPSAESRIKRGLILFEVANAENIEVTPEEVQEEVNLTVSQLLQAMPEEEARRRLAGNALQGLVSQIMSDRIAQRAGERLRAIASGQIDEIEEPEEAESEADKIEDQESPDQTVLVSDPSDEEESQEPVSETLAEFPASSVDDVTEVEVSEEDSNDIQSDEDEKVENLTEAKPETSSESEE